MQHPNLDDIGRRPQRYWNVDGLPEIVMGVLWMVWGGAWLFGETLPRDWRWNTYWTFTPAILAFSGVAAIWVTKRLKARLTFPRAGYVEWREPGRAAHLGGAAVAIGAAILLVLALRSDEPGRHVAPVLGVIVSLAFLVASIRQRAPHLLALAGVSVALGLALGTLRGGWMSANWLFVGLGAALALVGAMRLALFLRRHPRPSMEGA